MWKYLNKGISTPLAIIIILVLASMVGGYTFWQYSKIQKEESQIIEVELSEKEEVKDETADWKIARIEGKTRELNNYIYEMKYPKDWSYTTVDHPSYPPVMFAPEDIIIKVKESLQNIEGDKSFVIWVSVYDKNFFERGILPYINLPSKDFKVGENQGTYYTREYIKDEFGYKTGDKTITVVVLVGDVYYDFYLWDDQYLDVFEKMLSTFKFID